MSEQKGIGIDLDDVQAVERQQILVIEDEPDTVYLLKQVLRIAGFNVMSALGGQEALKKLSDNQPDLVLLDLMMPEMSGWDVFNYLRQMTDVPVIIISAVGEKEEIVKGLHLGVDDYITKPFHNAEVVERVRAVLRRANKQKEVNRLVFPNINLVVDFTSQEAVLNGTELSLTPKEFAILAVLAKNAPGIVRYETIAHSVWHQDSPEVRNRTKYLVYLLRRKFEDVLPGSNLILNMDRRGYRLQTGE